MKNSLKSKIKSLRNKLTFWISKQNSGFLKEIREHELNQIVSKLPEKCKILEIGGGSGWQAKNLEKLGYKVFSIDVKDSFYLQEKIFDVQIYDGINIPFKNKKFDVIFSSNVLEHIKSVDNYQKEISRVLKDDGLAIHIIPSATWRMWTIITDIMKSWYLAGPHGEHAPNIFIEILFFQKSWWIKQFINNDWNVLSARSNYLFYTGNSIFGSKISIKQRVKLSKILGSSCNIFFLKKSIDKTKQILRK